MMLTAAVADGQLPLLTVQRNIVLPAPSELTGEEKLLADEIVAEPVSRLHKPLPTVGFVAFKMADAAQIV